MTKLYYIFFKKYSVLFSNFMHLSTVKDPTSDMALNSRKGSLLLRDVREKKEMMKMRKRFWELGGSRMGDAMGNYNSITINDTSCYVVLLIVV